MKKIFQKYFVSVLLVILTIVSLSCGTHIEGDLDREYRKSFIQTYVKPRFIFEKERLIDPYLDTVVPSTPIDICAYGDFVRYGTSEHDSLANHYGDTSFNDFVYFNPPQWPVLADPVTKIEVVALEDYDDTHPKGSLLNDILYISYGSYAKVDSISDSSTDHINQNKCMVNYTRREHEDYYCLVKDIDYRTMVLPVRRFGFYPAAGKGNGKKISVLFRFHTAKQVFEVDTPLKIVNRK